MVTTSRLWVTSVVIASFANSDYDALQYVYAQLA